MSIRATEGTPSAGAAFRRYCAEVDNLRVAITDNHRYTAVVHQLSGTT